MYVFNVFRLYLPLLPLEPKASGGKEKQREEGRSQFMDGAGGKTWAGDTTLPSPLYTPDTSGTRVGVGSRSRETRKEYI